MRASTFPSLCAVLLFCLACPVFSVVYTGKSLTTGLNLVSFKLEDLTSLVNAIPANLPRAPQKVVDAYAAFIPTQEGTGDPIDPAAPKFPLVEQFAVIAATHNLYLEDRRFQQAILTNIGAFTKAQKTKLAGLIQRELAVIQGFEERLNKFTPDVIEIFRADVAVERATIRATVAELNK